MLKTLGIGGFILVILAGFFLMSAVSTPQIQTSQKTKEQIYSELSAQISYELSHGPSKHEGDSELARSCIEKYGADLTYAKDDMRRIQICLITDGKVGIAIQVLEKIQGKWQELTSFCNWDITDINTVIGFVEEDMGKYGWITYVKEIWKGLIHLPY
jgi:hypothetical protein